MKHTLPRTLDPVRTWLFPSTEILGGGVLWRSRYSGGARGRSLLSDVSNIRECAAEDLEDSGEKKRALRNRS